MELPRNIGIIYKQLTEITYILGIKFEQSPVLYNVWGCRFMKVSLREKEEVSLLVLKQFPGMIYVL